MGKKIDCSTCLHEKVCALWGAHECQDASCFSLDGCDYYEQVRKDENKPLTRKELRMMNGDPVYIVRGDVSWWDIVRYSSGRTLFLLRDGELPYCDLGKKWNAYRRPPEAFL